MPGWVGVHFKTWWYFLLQWWSGSVTVVLGDTAVDRMVGIVGDVATGAIEYFGK